MIVKSFWKWWPVSILTVSYNTLKITRAPNRERDWRQLGNQWLILAHTPSHSEIVHPRHFPLTHLSKGSSLTYQFNDFLRFCKILIPVFIISCLPNVILRTHKVTAREFPVPRSKESRIRGSKHFTLWSEQSQSLWREISTRMILILLLNGWRGNLIPFSNY